MEERRKNREASVRIADLRLLIERCMAKEVDERAQTMVLTRPGNSDPQAAMAFAQMVSEAKPQARKYVEARYHRLREALETGNNVAPALAAFLGRDFHN